MNKDLEKQLTDKYAYMFAEKARSLELLEKHRIITDKIMTAQAKGDTDTVEQLKKESWESGSYYPIAFGCECQDGWYDLLDELMGKIQELDKGKIVEVHQIKEKLGGLRFYINDGSVRMDIFGSGSFEMGGESDYEAIRNIISEYEDKSYITCEICGKSGRLSYTKGRWYKTVCKEHRHLEIYDGAIQEYTPAERFHVEQMAISLTTNTISKVSSYSFNDQEDEYYYTLENLEVVREDKLKHVPNAKFWNDSVVIKKNSSDAEYVITDKKFDVEKGWIYEIRFDDPIINDPVLSAEEQELEHAFTTDEQGHKTYKFVK